MDEPGGAAAGPPRAVVGRSLGRIRDGWTDVVAVTAILVVPLYLLSAFLQRDALAPDATVGPGGAGAGVMVLGVVDLLVVTPLVLGVALLVLAGGDRDRDRLLGRSGRAWRRLVRVIVAEGLLAMLPLVPGALLFSIGAPSALDGPGDVSPLLLAGGMLMLLGLVPSVYIGLGLTVAAPVAVLEEARAWPALKASWARMRGARWAALLGMLGTGLVVGLPAFLLTMLVRLLAFGLGPAAWSLEGLARAALALAGALVAAAVQGVLYDDTRPAQPPGDG